ncbi:MAG: pentapeptide repeat-containing protein, partial [Gemmataceae bacterium]
MARAARKAKTSAKKSGKQPAGGPLAGKTVAFVGKFGYADMFLETYQGYAKKAGANVVDAESGPDILVVGEGRGGNPPAAVAKIQKKHPAVQVLEVPDFCQLLVPSVDEVIAFMRAKTAKGDERRWDEFNALLGEANVTIDLRGADLRAISMDAGAHLERFQLDGADLRKVAAHYAHLPPLSDVNLDGADLNNAYFNGATNCSFRRADLNSAWLCETYYQTVTYTRCDFSEARLAKARLEHVEFQGCTFTKVDLSDAELEEVDLSGADLSGVDLSRAVAAKVKLADANLSRAKLHRADLRGANLSRADLRNADLREAILSDADLTGAKIDGADFARAVLVGAKLKGLNTAKAKNFTPPVERQPGPKLKELARGAGNKFKTSAQIELERGEHATLAVARDIYSHKTSFRAYSSYRRDDHDAQDQFALPTLEEAMIKVAERWPGATLRFDTIEASGCRTPRGEALKKLALAAWAEAFGVAAAAPQELEARKASQQAELEKLRAAMRKELTGGVAGVKKWNARPERERDQVGPLHNLDLHKANLAGVQLGNCDLT